jgi:hypothetical protein
MDADIEVQQMIAEIETQSYMAVEKETDDVPAGTDSPALSVPETNNQPSPPPTRDEYVQVDPAPGMYKSFTVS